jgi:dienelactone hydrolase
MIDRTRLATLLPFSPGKATPPLEHSRLIPRHAVDRLRVHDHDVHVDMFEPQGLSRNEAVLLLHGVGGLLGDGGLMRRAARRMAAHGFHACVVHYFNVTGTFFATHANTAEHVCEWKEALVEIAEHYSGKYGMPVGVMGYSFGGCLAVSIAQEVDGIGAVAVMCGGLSTEHELLTPAHLPAMLVLHGQHDAKVPPDRATALVQMGLRAGAVVESVLYPGEGHSFGARAERDAIERAAEFFESRLETGGES